MNLLMSEAPVEDRQTQGFKVRGRIRMNYGLVPPTRVWLQLQSP